ncbi:uncharacterized protein OGAPODRAFT_100787 [Ogataea polymorpha]|uniref:RNA helicase n=1 Tax=Ogataea polymorpha TaxID=460523 RepID=A0A1B7SHH0_9ASCO|nr:uncharacterized protein OGAPODRAFT_100787 [Ogataea polymorpha]KAG7930598.1 hypothetical protein KL934_004671 [Ogataea polymorpha]KAH3678673.1 hypothetical protein OGATHE_000223 [Ogataea polymorpha]OBA15949.1 hypothetical protein OGAPODRAFT_100787 [Ogataea polymorpha]
MSLPPSLDDLVKTQRTNGKTRFLSKSQREKRKQQQVVKPPSAVVKPQLHKKKAPDPSFANSSSKSDGDTNDAEFPPVVDLPRRRDDLIFDDVHWSEKELSQMTNRDWRIMREDYNISTKGGKLENPLRKWEESQISPLILQQLETLGYTEPTPIQRAAVPNGLCGRDLVGIAETGSGKTLAFLIPSVNYILQLPRLGRFEGPYVLILVPTRELALQIEREFSKFASLGFDVISLIGGHSYDEHAEKLERGVEVIIATPGRLVDCLEQQLVSLERCFFLVLDEADRMIDMGFEKDLKKILESLPDGSENPHYLGSGEPKRTTMMFTATMPPQIEKISAKYLKSPGTVMVGEVGGAVDSVRQEAIQVEDSDEKRLQMLQKVLSRGIYSPPIIIFVNFRKTCEMVAEFLEQLGFNAVTMHGSKTQEQREYAIQQIKEGRSDILVATDVAGRGIDIPDVSLVLNFQMAKNIEDYTHRIGRTGRAGKEGTAITFWSAADADVLYDLKQMIAKSPVSRCPEELRRHPAAQKRMVKNIET